MEPLPLVRRLSQSYIESDEMMGDIGLECWRGAIFDPDLPRARYVDRWIPSSRRTVCFFFLFAFWLVREGNGKGYISTRVLCVPGETRKRIGKQGFWRGSWQRSM